MTAAMPDWIDMGVLAKDTAEDFVGEIAQIGSGYTSVEANPTYVWLRPVGGGIEHLARIADLEQFRSCAGE
ncbi:hypothetical protein [Streptomyces sp. SYSU K217416]